MAQPLTQAAVRLTCTTPEFNDFWQLVMGESSVDGAYNPQERAQLRAEIDARVADLYALSEKDFAYVLSTFPLLDRDQPALPGEPKSFITRDLALLALFSLRGLEPPADIVAFFADAGVDIRQQTGTLLDLRERVRVASEELGAVAYQPSRREREESEPVDEDELELDEEEYA